MAFVGGVKRESYTPGMSHTLSELHPIETTYPSYSTTPTTKVGLWGSIVNAVNGFNSGLESLGQGFRAGVAGSESYLAGAGDLLSNITGWKSGADAFSSMQKGFAEEQNRLTAGNEGILGTIGGLEGSVWSFMVPGMAAGKIPGAISKTPAVVNVLSKLFEGAGMTAFQSAMDAGNVYEQNKAMGKSEAESQSAAEKDLGVSVIVNSIANHFMINAEGQSALKVALKGAAPGAIQGIATQIATNVFTNKNASDGWLESGLVGGIIGGTIGIASSSGRTGEVKEPAIKLEETSTKAPTAERTYYKNELVDKLGISQKSAGEIADSMVVAYKKYDVKDFGEGIELVPKGEDVKSYTNNAEEISKMDFAKRIQNTLKEYAAKSPISDTENISSQDFYQKYKDILSNNLGSEAVKKSQITNDIDGLSSYAKDLEVSKASAEDAAAIKRSITTKFSSIRRKMLGTPLESEIVRAQKYLNSDYEGKLVEVKEGSGTIIGKKWGKIQVETESGVGLYDKSNILSADASRSDAIDYLKIEGEKELSIAKNDYPGYVSEYTGDTKSNALQIMRSAIKQDNQIKATDYIANTAKEFRGSTTADNIPGEVVSGVAKKVSQGLEPTELATYKPGDKAYQETRISDMIKNNLSDVKDILAGRTAIPDDVDGGYLWKKMAEYASKTGDNELNLELAKSPLASIISERGRDLSMTSLLTEETAPDIIRTIMKDTEAEVTRKSGGRDRQYMENVLEKKAQKFVDKLKPNKDNLKKFIDDIKC